MAPTKTAKSWPVQDAKAHFSEMLEASLTEGPQIVTRRGVEAAVLVNDATGASAVPIAGGALENAVVCAVPPSPKVHVHV